MLSKTYLSNLLAWLALAGLALAALPSRTLGQEAAGSPVTRVPQPFLLDLLDTKSRGGGDDGGDDGDGDPIVGPCGEPIIVPWPLPPPPECICFDENMQPVPCEIIDPPVGEDG